MGRNDVCVGLCGLGTGREQPDGKGNLYVPLYQPSRGGGNHAAQVWFVGFQCLLSIPTFYE